MEERFDRIRRPAVERPRAVPEVFSAADGEDAEGPGGGSGWHVGEGLALHCSRCGATSRLDVATAVRAAWPLFVVLPWRRHPVFALCPACHHRAWLRPVPGGVSRA